MDVPLREKVLASIEEYGWHYCRVGGGPSPVWTYTIGLQQTHQCPELVMAGASSFSRRDIQGIFREVVGSLPDVRPKVGEVREVRSVSGGGSALFREVHPSWVRELMADAIDFSDGETVEALQIVPTGGKKTIDTPDLSAELGSKPERPWRWLHDEWPYEIAKDTVVLTDLDALHGAPVVKVWRNQDDARGPAWEMFSSDVNAIGVEIGRVVPLGTLLASDPTLEGALGLKPGKSTARYQGSSTWGAKSEPARGKDAGRRRRPVKRGR